MWIATPTYGLMSYRDGRLEPCLGPPEHEKVVTQALFEDRENRLWVSIGNGTVLCRTNHQWLTFNETNGLPFAYVTSLTQDSEGTIWAGSLDDGLYRLNGTNFNVLRKKDGLSADDIRSLYCDHEGDLWVGTRTGGLNRLRQPKLTVISSGQGLTNDFTRSVAQTPDGTIWVGTTGGSLYRGGLTGFEPFRPEPVVYFYANVDPVLAAPDGSLWWGGLGALLHWQNNRLTDCFTNEPWQQNVFITALQNDRHGGIWIGTAGGQLVHMQDGHFTEFPKPITRAPISTLAVQPDGSVWVGTVANGVNRIHEGNEAVYAITNGLSRKASIRTFYLDDAGTLWIGTAGGGLLILARRLQSLLGISAESPSLGADGAFAAPTESATRGRGKGRSRRGHPRGPTVPVPGSRAAAPAQAVEPAILTPAAQEPSPPKQPCRRCGGCGADSRLRCPTRAKKRLGQAATATPVVGPLTSESGPVH